MSRYGAPPPREGLPGCKPCGGWGWIERMAPRPHGKGTYGEWTRCTCNPPREPSA